MTRRRALLLLTLAAAIVVIIAGALVWRRESLLRQVRVAGRTIGPAGVALADVVVGLAITPRGSEDELPVERVYTRSDPQGNFEMTCRVRWRAPSYTLEAKKPGYDTLEIEHAEELSNPITLRLVLARR